MTSAVEANAAAAAADVRAREVEEHLTDEERFSLIIGVMGQLPGFVPERDERIPEGTKMSAAYTSGVPRLGVPALQMSDASMGVTNPGYANREGDTATAMPACIALGASFNTALARASGEAIGKEARSRGFNVQLAGGINLARDPRNGRTFEYLSEDPWHSAVIAAESVNGIQSQGVISTLKHYTLNCNETNRHWLDAIIDPAAHRESDLLAFEIAIERSHPGAIMSAYNMVNGAYASGNDVTLNQVLKGAWGYPGWVMSDWGATKSWEFALAGLDQECGVQIDVRVWGAEQFTEPLKNAYEEGTFSKERLSDMARRILRSMFAVGIDRWEGEPDVDLDAHNQISLETARQGIVLLKNEEALPLPADEKLKIAVIGGYAQLGVVSGIGSGAVIPKDGYAAVIPIGGPGLMGGGRNLFVMPSSPLTELRKLLPDAEIDFDPGQTPAEAALLAKRSDIVIAFGIRVEGESYDLADLSLPWGQDALIEAVATANPNTIVVLETGNPVSMPWRDEVKAIVQAWYPGQAGGQAIAEVLTGTVNPSGRLPITFPDGLDQHPRPQLPGLGTPWGTPTTIEYQEGAEIGYRWYAKTGAKPLYAFGHGLTYTSFAYSELTVEGGDTVRAAFTVTNTGDRRGADVPQLYLTEAAGEKRIRLLGFERVELEPGESQRVTVAADRRLLSRFDADAAQWRTAAGTYAVAVGRAADALELVAETELTGTLFGR
ncbi:MAG: glycoside hydrolase family 3 C-terminal domain-containing protein [Solirubrobacteraceae bacterium]